MSYKCADCKDKGFIILLTSTVRCECRKTDEARTSKDTGHRGRPYWFAGYDSYAEYVADMNRQA